MKSTSLRYRRHLRLEQLEGRVVLHAGPFWQTGVGDVPSRMEAAPVSEGEAKHAAEGGATLAAEGEATLAAEGGATLAAEGEGQLVADFSLPDTNPTSTTYNQLVSPRDFVGRVSGWYFGHAT